jgi:hypothetical protein
MPPQHIRACVVPAQPHRALMIVIAMVTTRVVLLGMARCQVMFLTFVLT